MSNPEHAGSPLAAVVLLAAVATITGSGVALVQLLSAERIAANEIHAREQRVAQILPANGYDNLPGSDRVTVNDALLGDTPQVVFRARQAEVPVAGVIQVTAPDGYNGSIVLLVSVNLQGEVLGVRTLSHRETPGLGDGIDIARNDWMTRFDGLSLSAPDEVWTVRRDGGQFDQLTGATVTSRAVIGAVRNALLYFDRNRSGIFAAPSEP